MIRAVTLDLDDTLWPIEPVILSAESELDEWLRSNCPEVAEAWPVEAMRELRTRVFAENPHLSHDFSALRKLSLAQAFQGFDRGDDWVERAYEVYFDARNRVELYPEARAALESLAARWPLASISNGNADLHRIGLGEFFVAMVSSRVVGHAKPDARIFRKAAVHLGLEPHEIVHVGDDPELDVLGAKRAGMFTVWLNRHGAQWAHAERPDIEVRTLEGLEAALDALVAERRAQKERTA